MGTEWVALAMTGFTLGLAYAAVPGPVNTESARRGLAGGFGPAALVQVGAIAGDAVWAVIGLSGAIALTASPGVTSALDLAGAALILSLAVAALRASPTRLTTATTTTGARRHLATGAAFSLANPISIAFWAGVGGGVARTLGDPDGGTLALVLLCFLGGTLLWSVGFAGLIAAGRRHVGAGLHRAINLGCAAILGFFGLSLLWSVSERVGPDLATLVGGWLGR